MKKLFGYWRLFALFGIALLGLLLRLYGLNWDQGNGFHPDEREIVFVVMTLSWPKSWSQFLDPQNSPLNPHFFAYGSFPLYLLAISGRLMHYASSDPQLLTKLTHLGRVLSALFDTGTILLAGWLVLLLSPQKRDLSTERNWAWGAALLAAALVAFTPFQLQLSHFYAVDTLVNFFVLLAIVSCVAFVGTQRMFLWAGMIGLAYGLAVATKTSSLPLAAPICVACGLRLWRTRAVLDCVLAFVFLFAVAGFLCVMTQPYALLDWTNFYQQVSQQSDLVRGLLDYPYVRQFAGTVPFVYQLQNLVFWGMGLTLGCASLLGLIWMIWCLFRWRIFDAWLVVLSWVLLYGIFMCSMYVKFMRYMLPIYPLLSVVAAYAICQWIRDTRWAKSGLVMRVRWLRPALQILFVCVVLGGTMFQGLALLNVYSTPDTRVLASEWIYAHIPAGSTLTYEQWDDPLPIAIGNHSPSEYVQATYIENGQEQTGLDLYGDDTLQKAEWLSQLLPTVYAITMPTDRLDKSIPKLPVRYPLTIHYYQLLFSGKLGFHLAAEFENHPHLLGITLNDSSADESYSVFDHPTSRIFVRDNPYPYTSAQLLNILTAGVTLPSVG